ncbi:uncharacterized protein LOC130308590 isoform X2 [Hyla sarda]|uniref:uncharacterized protein LOC130308590 isoform X2 n=1 Tax=Hyla sarda TaxID=327740 RepID=UPI0024C359C2|nr:uncharacterized protein LOC130308590 isoform X2 [Hyla sarda]
MSENMSGMNPEREARELAEVVQELNVELERLSRNVQSITRYQAQVFQITKVLCSWMENIEELARHRNHLHSPPDASR